MYLSTFFNFKTTSEILIQRKQYRKHHKPFEIKDRDTVANRANQPITVGSEQ